MPVHALDQLHAEDRRAPFRALAFLATEILALARLEEDLDDGAFVDTVALDDAKPALGLAAVLIDLLPQPDRAQLGGTHGSNGRAEQHSADDQLER